MKYPEPSPVKGRPVRLDPWAPGASPKMRTRALGSPNPGTGFAQYSQSAYARRFTRPISSRYATSLGQSRQSTTAWFSSGRDGISAALWFARDLVPLRLDCLVDLAAFVAGDGNALWILFGSNEATEGSTASRSY